MANGNFGGGTGVEGDPYLIEDAFDLDAVRNDLSGHYKLINDIDLDIAPFNEGEGWVPIGDSTSPFLGHFNGNGHIIKNLYINRLDSGAQGLFGEIRGSFQDRAHVENLGVISANVKGVSSTGIIVGRTSYSNVTHVFSTGEVSGDNHIGGFVGAVNSYSNFSNCYSVATVSGEESIGGFAGRVYASTVRNSYSAGHVEGDSLSIGGFLGTSGQGERAPWLTITRCFWDNERSGQTRGGYAVIGKNTQEMKTAQTFSTWSEEQNEDGEAVWILKDGIYPRLWFEKDYIEHFLIKDGDNTKTFNNQNWQTISSSPPIRDDFYDHGFYSLEVLTKQTISQLSSREPELLYYVGRKEDSKEIKVDYSHNIWTRVSTSTPTLQQFKDNGMIDLSVLDRKERTQTQDMIDLGEYHNGKMYSAKVDLSKHFSIDELRVK